MDDPFIRTYIDGVLKNIRTQVILKLIKPYTRIEISSISKVELLMNVDFSESAPFFSLSDRLLCLAPQYPRSRCRGFARHVDLGQQAPRKN